MSTGGFSFTGFGNTGKTATTTPAFGTSTTPTFGSSTNSGFGSSTNSTFGSSTSSTLVRQLILALVRRLVLLSVHQQTLALARQQILPLVHHKLLHRSVQDGIIRRNLEWLVWDNNRLLPILFPLSFNHINICFDDGLY